MGMMDCGFVARGNTPDEVIKKANDHVGQVHPDKLREMKASMSETEMKDQMMAAMKEA